MGKKIDRPFLSQGGLAYSLGPECRLIQCAVDDNGEMLTWWVPYNGLAEWGADVRELLIRTWSEKQVFVLTGENPNIVAGRKRRATN